MRKRLLHGHFWLRLKKRVKSARMDHLAPMGRKRIRTRTTRRRISYRRRLPEYDPLQAEMAACCELHPHAWCLSRALWETYQRRTATCPEPYPLSRGAFIRQLKRHGCQTDRTMRARIWRGIALAEKVL